MRGSATFCKRVLARKAPQRRRFSAASNQEANGLGRPPKSAVIFSGIQPSGSLHLGNYVGALKNWVALQSQTEAEFEAHPTSEASARASAIRLPISKRVYCIVDMHATTVPQDPAALRESVLALAASFIACGLDPKRNLIFQQSAVSAHAELAWILGCHTPLGWLNRMTQFKEKSTNRENVSLGLYGYPVLQAADILLYNTTHVPVGADQIQHLEFARDLAIKFNSRFQTQCFVLPTAVVPKSGVRIMNLRDGTSKMSKSHTNDMTRINLTDDADLIRLKIRRAKTDSIDGISFDPASRPAVSNLVDIFAAVTDSTPQQIVDRFGASSSLRFKEELVDAVVARIAPISREIARLRADRPYLASVLESGNAEAARIANETLRRVKETVGYL